MSTAAQAVAAAINMLEDVEATLRGASDCAGRAGALQAWQAANTKRLAEVRAGMKAHTPAELKPEVERQMKASAVVTTLFEIVRGCVTDSAFADAWEAVAKVMD